MKIEFGKIEDNKVKRFLVPGLRSYGSTFKSFVGQDMFKLAWGIHDTLLDGTDVLKGKKPIFMLCDKAVNPARTWKAMEWMFKFHGRILDYSFDTCSPSRQHMFVIDFPEELYHAYSMFVKGKYSEMYTPSQIKEYFPDTNSAEYMILTKDKRYMPTFIKKIEDTFEVEIEDKKGYTTTELEFPWNMTKETARCEVFNY